MDCERIETLLGAHLDDELRPAEAAGVRAHLGECPGCRSRLATLRAVRAAVRDLRPGRSEAGLEAVLERARAVPAAPAESLRRRRRLRWVGIAAGVALAAGAAVWLALDPEPPPGGADPVESVAPDASVAPEQLQATPAACLRPEDCGPEAELLWPPISI